MPTESVLSLYWELASTNEKARLKAAADLIKSLREAQQKHRETLRKDEPSENIACSEQLEYGLKRLVKGLASSRKGARQGFATVLTEIIHSFDCVSVHSILQLMKENLEATGPTKSQEERDSLFGQVFGMVAIIRAKATNGRLPFTGTTGKGSPGLSVSFKLHQHSEAIHSADWLKHVVHTLKQLSLKKSYLQEVCIKAIVDIFPLVSFPVFEKHVFVELKSDIEHGWVGATPETLLIALAVQRHYGEQLGKKVFKKSWNCSSIADVQNYERMAKVLQESSLAHPRVHSAWSEVLHCIVSNPKSDLEQFWRITVDEHLFQSTHDRKYLGFQLVERMLSQITHEQVPAVISSTFLRCLINNLSSGQSYLLDAAKRLVSSMSLAVSQNSDEGVTGAVIQQLLGRYGSLQFDRITKTRLVDSLMGTICSTALAVLDGAMQKKLKWLNRREQDWRYKLKESAVQTLVRWFCETFEKGCVEKDAIQRLSARDVEMTRIAVLNLLLSLVKNKDVEQTKGWVNQVLCFMLQYSYFQPIEADEKSMAEVTPSVREICEQRLIGALRALSPAQVKKPGEKSAKQEDGRQWMSSLIHHAKKLLSSGDFKVRSSAWSDETEEAFEKASKTISKIHKKCQEEGHSAEDEVFELLFLHITLQLFSEPDQAVDILEELKMCYKNTKESELKSHKKGKPGKPHWVEVLTEILLSLLTRPSNLLRHVVDQVFSAISSHLTEGALQLILDAVDPRKEGREEDGTLEVVEDSADEEDENMQQDNGQHTQDDDDTDIDESSDEESDDDDNEDDDDENNNGDVDEAFRAEVQAALGDAAADDQASDEDEDLDDEAMMRIDDALAAVFRSQLKARKDKKKKKDATRTVMHFKLRVMDIIEIFIKKQPRSPLIFNLMEPLLDLVWSCANSKEQGSLGDRAQAIYKNRLCSLREYPDPKELDVEDLHSKIEHLVRKAMKAPSMTIVSHVSLGCIFLVRVLQGGSRGHNPGSSRDEKHRSKAKAVESSKDSLLDVERVLDIFKEALVDFMERRSTHLHAVLFTELINRMPVLGWCLAPEIVKYLDSAVNNFRKTQAIIMVSQLLCQKIPEYQEKLKSISHLLQTELVSIFHKSKDSDIKAKHFRELQKLTQKLLKEAGNFQQVLASLRREELATAIEESLDGPLSTRCSDIRNTSNRLLTTLSGSSNEQQKRKPKIQKRKNGDVKTVNQERSEVEEQNLAGEPQRKKRKKEKRKHK